MARRACSETWASCLPDGRFSLQVNTGLKLRVNVLSLLSTSTPNYSRPRSFRSRCRKYKRPVRGTETVLAVEALAFFITSLLDTITRAFCLPFPLDVNTGHKPKIFGSSVCILSTPTTGSSSF